MVSLLMRSRALLVGLCTWTCALGADLGERHEWSLGIDLGAPYVSTDLAAWTDGGLSKLRFDADTEGATAHRLAFEYHGRITNTLSVETLVDYVDDASAGVDVTEAYLKWRPIPASTNQHQVRVGAFYPPLSLENGGFAWSSPFTTSFSAINTWLGEEIRPIGIEWSLQRRIGFPGGPHRVGGFVSAFYGNDPAGTLLFWRGFALHDRQTRLNDRLPLPPRPVFGAGGSVTGLREQSLEPFEEIDDEPGYYAGFEWRYARLALVQIATYDNRADPYSFRDGQWSWRTRFDHVGVQLGLPKDIGLVAQWMRGATYWLIATTPSGLLLPSSELVRDDFASTFVLLTKRLTSKHRLSLRYDEFAIERSEALDIDGGDAWTLAYQFQPNARLGIATEWLQIRSVRDLWADFYGQPAAARETQLRLQLTYRLNP